MRNSYLLLVTGFALALVPQQRSYAEWYGEMVQAYRDGDDVAMAAAAEGALGARPGFPSMMVNLALARAQLGEHEAALDLLDEVAAMGLSYPVADSERFAPLSGLPRFAEIVERMQANAAPRGHAEVAFNLEPLDYFPEGIAVDPASGDTFVGSVRHGTIARVSDEGEAEPFARLPWAAMGMRVDRQRDLLWVAISGLEQRQGLAATRRGRAGIAAVDLAEGLVMGEYLLPEGVERVVGDLVVAPDGNVYATDSIAGGVWVLRPGTDSMVPFLPDGTFASPQGIDLDADGTLYVAAYNGGVYRIEAGVPTELMAPSDVSVYGIDGLYAHDGGLIAIQNGVTPHRVLRLSLDETGAAISGATVLLGADPRFGEPTLGAVTEDSALLLVANSPWAHFEDPQQPPDAADLPAPTVLRFSLR